MRTLHLLACAQLMLACSTPAIGDGSASPNSPTEVAPSGQDAGAGSEMPGTMLSPSDPPPTAGTAPASMPFPTPETDDADAPSPTPEPAAPDGESNADSAIFQCPETPSQSPLELATVQLEIVQGLPLEDGFSPGFSILEGPVWYQGALLFSQIASGQSPPPARIFRLEAGGSVSVLLETSGANGLAIDNEGRLLGASHAQGGIVRFADSPSDGVNAVLVDRYEGSRFNSPNDIAVHSAGHLYFSDPDWQAPNPRPQSAERAYMLDMDGTLRVLDGAPGKPNGVALSLDERSLFVGGNDGLLRFGLDASGIPQGSPERVADIYGGVDGLGRDCAGRLYVTSGSELIVVGADGSREGSIRPPGGEQLTNVAFGGADGRTLFVTSLGSTPRLMQAQLPVTGHPF